MNSRFVWLALLAATGLSSAQEPTPAPSVQPPPSGAGIATVVNGRTISKSQLNSRLSREYAKLAAQFPNRGPEFERRVLEARNKIQKELIDREIALSEQEKKGANLPGKGEDATQGAKDKAPDALDKATDKLPEK